MSLSSFQTAMATLIRLPDHNRGDQLEPFLSDFKLTPVEKTRLEALSRDPKLAKYGRAMASVRWGVVERQLGIALPFLSPSALAYFFQFWFEPAAVRVGGPERGPAFLDLLLSSEGAAPLYAEGPPFLRDLLVFERARMRFRGELTVASCPAPAGSALAHLAFLVLRLDHDIPSYVARLATAKDQASIAPEPRPLRVLMIPSDVAPGYRCFEIDEETAGFLDAGARQSEPSSALSTYEDLVAIGVCRPREQP